MSPSLEGLTGAGFSVVRGLLEGDDLARARSLVDPSVDVPFHVSNIHASVAGAHHTDAGVRGLLGRAMREAMPAHDPFLGAVITKGPGAGAVDVHQDWTYTDERVAPAVVVWVPLVDTDAATGALRVLPASHLWTSGIRPGGGPLATEPHAAGLASLARTLDLRAGDACVYDPALLHGSWPNAGERPRPAVAAAFAPLGAPLLHFDASQHDLVGHRVDPAYFLRRPYGVRPDHAPDALPWADPVRAEDFVPHLTAGAA